MRKDLEYLQQEVKETQEVPKKYSSRLKQIAYGVEPLEWREETPRERTMRLYPHTMPSPALVKRVKREIGITSLGSPGTFEDLLAWAKKNWVWLVSGGALYTVLLIACARRGK